MPIRDSTADLDPDKVRQWIVETEAEVIRLDAEADAIQTALAEARKRLMLYHELLAALTKAPVKVSDEELRIGRSVRERTIRATAEILGEFERPMTIQEIHGAFIRQGKPLPGRGTPTNIVAHISTSPLFVRRGRGIYALAEWGEEKDGPPGTLDDKQDDWRQKAASRR
jgi:hypothetical protein